MRAAYVLMGGAVCMLQKLLHASCRQGGGKWDARRRRGGGASAAHTVRKLVATDAEAGVQQLQLYRIHCVEPPAMPCQLELRSASAQLQSRPAAAAMVRMAVPQARTDRHCCHCNVGAGKHEMRL